MKVGPESGLELGLARETFPGAWLGACGWSGPAGSRELAEPEALSSAVCSANPGAPVSSHVLGSWSPNRESRTQARPASRPLCPRRALLRSRSALSSVSGLHPIAEHSGGQALLQMEIGPPSQVVHLHLLGETAEAQGGTR